MLGPMTSTLYSFSSRWSRRSRNPSLTARSSRLPRTAAALVALWVAGSLAGCGGGSQAGSGGASNSGQYAQARQACVDAINHYRSTLGLKPYARWSSAETCADGQAKSDSQSGTDHGAFTSGNACGAIAENECPNWPSVGSIVADCLQRMWNEGPGSNFEAHGHYIIMSSTRYSRVACGFYVTPQGSVWAVQDFK